LRCSDAVFPAVEIVAIFPAMGGGAVGEATGISVGPIDFVGTGHAAFITAPTRAHSDSIAPGDVGETGNWNWRAVLIAES
jgi:hypothetical protein